jgi:L-seryl-tRNA(Ser) seleniumtransferase
MAGFTVAPEQAAVARIAHEHDAIVIDDLGSGALLPTERFGLVHEPMPAERLAAGSDVVTFSGDKLVGGPQAGLVVGRADLIARVRRDPLARAVRPDKVALAGIALTLGLYRAGWATTDIPVWRMIATPVDDLRRRADAIAAALGVGDGDRDDVEVVEHRSTVGGGSLPSETLPSVGLALRSRSVSRTLARLRDGTPAVIGRVQDERVVLDLRTVPPEADASLIVAIGIASER